MYKNIYQFSFFLLCALISQTATAQNLSGIWIEVEDDHRITKEEFFESYSDFLVLNDQESFELNKIETDNLGKSHYRYDQYRNGIRVEGSQFILHESQGFIELGNGTKINGISAPSVASITAEQSLQTALDYIGADQYAWQNAGMQALIKRIHHDPTATFLPVPELVYADRNYSRNGDGYQLVYKMEIHSSRPSNTQVVYVDAIHNQVLYTEEGCVHTEVPATGTSYFYGQLDIIADSIAPGEFQLIDNTRGGGIETWNLKEETEVDSAEIFMDDDNLWDTVNDEKDELAIDTHWSAEMTYDYFFENHDRDSYDNEGSKMLSYIHYGENTSNAFWNGQWATFGDGSSVPFNSIDIIGHEFAHGVTRTTAGLIYANESGALNESFSDIFGVMIKFHGLGDDEEWTIGAPGYTLRSMDNPNDYNDPDTYFGDFYYSGEFDNGGVHTNSSLQNFWFYLLAEGGIGSNDIGNDFQVNGMGKETAAAIAYRNLTVYLTPNSTFYDARIGSIYSAEDLYGSCSDEVIETTKAWFAVGVGTQNPVHDMKIKSIDGPFTSCDLEEEELVISFIYNGGGCGELLEAGEEFTLGYSLNGGEAISEVYTVEETILPGDTIYYTFSTLMDVSENDFYEISSWVGMDDDVYPVNDTVFDYNIIHIAELLEDEVLDFQDADFASLKTQFEENSKSEVRITPIAGNSSSRGLQMHGKNLWNFQNNDIPTEEEEVFNSFDEFESKMCSCVDTEGWDMVRLSFDLKQTYASLYDQEEFPDSINTDFRSCLRVLIDGVPVTGIYTPDTDRDDPYLTHVLNLDDYAGQYFELCFQSKNYLNKDQDDTPQSAGDNAYLDNIFLTTEDIVGLEDQLIGQNLSYSIFPNPSNGHFQITNIPSDVNQIQIIDLLGKMVASQNVTTGDSSNLEMDLSNLSKGVYLITLITDLNSYSEKVIIE